MSFFGLKKLGSQRVTTPKTKMTLENPPFEDVFPIENGDFPKNHVSFPGVFCATHLFHTDCTVGQGGWHPQQFFLRITCCYWNEWCLQEILQKTTNPSWGLFVLFQPEKPKIEAKKRFLVNHQLGQFKSLVKHFVPKKMLLFHLCLQQFAHDFFSHHLAAKE